ncbi:MAG: succinate dehydrogenase [Peptococcaceae bacterium]|jgi:succinate dehydrogenase / fumarate reductase iron-sulfur subunit|nr:succinate dehydrogenase [Peptococcaceae bacterium]
MAMEIVYRVKRFDGEKSYYQEYSIPYEKDRTILWGLIKIRDEIDPTLSFRSACRSAICGSCAIRVNSNALLACKTSLDKQLALYQTNILTLEPLANFPVIRDLVVDWENKFKHMTEVKPWLIGEKDCPGGTGYYRQSPDEFLEISNPTDCILCGCCVSECTQHTNLRDEFYEPFIFTKSWRFTADSRDNSPKAHLLPVLNEGGLWKCVRCQQCITKCPKGVRPADHISRLRCSSMNYGFTDNLGTRHAQAFAEYIQKTGRLNEVTLPLKTEGIFRTLKRIPFALRLLRKGKLRPLYFPSPIQGIEGIRKIYNRLRKEEKK